MGVFSSEAGNTDSLIRTKGRSNNSGLKKKKRKRKKRAWVEEGALNLARR